ncbi:MAG: hypothetical protein M1826_001419 [Phylliscum demangeonii]|nr:MAG: hypothetical protein M1826_001419 [Phylliscum demangeonii]
MIPYAYLFLIFWYGRACVGGGGGGGGGWRSSDGRSGGEQVTADDGFYRYLRFLVHCAAHWTSAPIPLPDAPSLTAHDVTVIIPTLDGGGDGLRETIRSCLATAPFEILLVTVEARYAALSALAGSLHTTRLRLFSVPRANKRRQMCRAIPEVRTAITVFADDDVTWPATMLRWMLAAFERADVGGVGTCQRLRRPARPNVWSLLGALYLERRNFEISGSTRVDGGISCLSGRTVAYRTHILQDPAFTHAFTHEYWRRQYRLNADDDNFLTRWMLSHGWKTHVQSCKEAELLTTLEDNARFLKQCLRWSRSNWRSNLTSMFTERLVWRRQPWSAYALHLATLSPPALIGDGLLVALCYKATEAWPPRVQTSAVGLLLAWLVLTKALKVLGHFIRYPVDVLLLPVSILFGYCHGAIKIYAGLTLNVVSLASLTTWGSRDGADTDDAYRMIRLSGAEKS